MSGQPLLDFGAPIAPTVAGAPVHSRFADVPGEGRYVVKCEQCRRVRRRKRDARFCSDLCKDLHRHDKQARIEAGKKRRGMEGSAAKNSEYLQIAREAAHRIRLRDGTADADRVRLLLDSEGTELSHWSGWSGSIFQSDPDYHWTAVDWTAAKHKASKCRPVRVWK